MLQQFLVFILFCTLLLNNLQAQTWPMPGAKWRYCEFYWNGDTNGDYYDFAYTEDTLINGKTYQIIRLTGTKVQPTITGYNKFSLYTRYSNDSVYRFVYNKDYLFFTFNTSIGSKQTSFRSNYDSWVDSACTANLGLKVTDDYVATYSGSAFRIIHLKDTAFKQFYSGPTGSSYKVEYRLAERLGVINNIFFTTIDGAGNKGECNPFGTDSPIIQLSKYKDDTFEHIFFDCKPSSINEIESKTYPLITPNPVNDFIVLSIDQFDQGKIIIYDIFGTVVLEEKFNPNQNKFDVSYLKDGVYYVYILSENYQREVHYSPFLIHKN